MQKTCYYEVLGVAKTASQDELKKAYRQLALKYHPDRCPDDPEAEGRFKDASEAYQVLNNQEKRGIYDRFGHAGLGGTAMHDFSGMRVDDIFSMFEDIFGGGSGSSVRQVVFPSPQR